MLPFLKKKILPTFRKPVGTSMYGFTEDEELSDSALDELIQAIDSKDHSAIMRALEALIEVIRNKHDASNDEETKLA